MQLSLRASSKTSGFRSGFRRFPEGFLRFPRFPATFPCVSSCIQSRGARFAGNTHTEQLISAQESDSDHPDRRRLREVIICRTKRTEKIESRTFPCLNQTGERSCFRFFCLRQGVLTGRRGRPPSKILELRAGLVGGESRTPVRGGGDPHL